MGMGTDPIGLFVYCARKNITIQVRVRVPSPDPSPNPDLALALTRPTRRWATAP